MSVAEEIVAEYLLKEKQYNYQTPPSPYTGTPESWLIAKIQDVTQEANQKGYHQGFTVGTNATPNSRSTKDE